jgi:hypothetical protein
MPKKIGSAIEAGVRLNREGGDNCDGEEVTYQSLEDTLARRRTARLHFPHVVLCDTAQLQLL